MSEKETIAFYCNDCDAFPSGVEMVAVGMNAKIYIECNDCGIVESYQG